MNELNRAIALLIGAFLSSRTQTQLDNMDADELAELQALEQLTSERGRASVHYHKTARGQAALARARS